MRATTLCPSVGPTRAVAVAAAFVVLLVLPARAAAVGVAPAGCAYGSMGATERGEGCVSEVTGRNHGPDPLSYRNLTGTATWWRSYESMDNCIVEEVRATGTPTYFLVTTRHEAHAVFHMIGTDTYTPYTIDEDGNVTCSDMVTEPTEFDITVDWTRDLGNWRYDTLSVGVMNYPGRVGRRDVHR